MSDSSTLQPELPIGEGLNQETMLDNSATAPSDDLFGEDPPESTEPSVPAEVKSAPSTEDLSSQPVTADAVDPQPSGAAPVTENSSGITPVTQFIPSDAKLDQPVVAPAEPLATEEAKVDKDTLMDDAPSQDVVSQEPASEATDSAPVAKMEPETSEGVQPGPDPVDSAASVPTPPAEKPDLPNGHVEESQVAAGSDQIVPKTQDDAPASAHETSTPKIVEPADQNMMDTPSSGTVRPRDDTDATDEPAAKRARTAEPSNDAAAKVKQPSAAAPAPAPVPSATATTNGSSSHPTPAPSQASVPKFSSEPMTPAQKSVLIEKIKNTKKVKSAAFFLKPVDHAALNIPHYPDVIKKPMDLGTMEKKLKGDKYSSVDDFVADFELMIHNCLTFNGPQHLVSISGQNLRAYFLKQMETVPTGNKAYPVAIPKPKKSSPKPPPRRESRVNAAPGAVRSPNEPVNTYALLPSGTPMIRRDSSAGRPKRAVIPPQRDLPYNQAKPKRKENQLGLKFCDHILDEFKRPRKMGITSAFLLPVDPVALNIPTYFNVVKKPMDLQTMTNKLKTGQYATAQEFKDDFDLMLNNCFIFNPVGNPVHEQGKALQTAFNQEWSRKDQWIKKNTPQSQRASPASDAESDGEESEEGEEDAEADGNEATIAMLRQQLVSMQQTIASISGAKPAKTKKKKSSTAAPKPTKKSSVSAAPKPVTKAKPKKQRQVTYEEKQEISNATENMNDEQIGKLTTIITENVAKYKDMDAEDVELEIDDLPNDVQHKLLRYVRSLFPPKAISDDGNAIDDDYEPERPAARATKKKHKPMKKHEQESRIKELQEQMSRLQGGLQGAGGLPKAPAPAPAQSHPQSSDEDDSESSEEE